MNTNRLFKAEQKGELGTFLSELSEQQTKLLIQQFKTELQNYERATKNYSDEKFQKFSVPFMAKRTRYLSLLSKELLKKLDEKPSWEEKLQETIDKTMEDVKDDLYIGPVGNDGLYQIGKGCFTGKIGYEQFIKKMDEL